MHEREQLQAIVQAGRDAETKLRALDAAADKANEPQPDAYTIETERVIAEHRLNDVDAAAFKRARAMAQFPAIVARQRDQVARAKRAADDAAIANNGEPDEHL